MKGCTYGFFYIYARSGNPPAQLASHSHSLYFPDRKGCATELGPDTAPASVLVRFGAIWVSVEVVNEVARKIDSLRMRRS